MNRAGPIERVSGWQTEADREEALRVMRDGFGTLAQVIRSRCSEPIFKPEHGRVVVANGHVVSAAIVGPRHIRFGPVKVPALTIGPVATDEACRKRGYAAALMNDITAYAKSRGILATYLGAIPDFYHRFGYYPFRAPVTATLRYDNTHKASLPGRMRKMTRKDVDAVRRIYNRVTKERICAAVRDRAVWDWLLGPGSKTWQWMNARVILDRKGAVHGYATGSFEDRMNLRELVVNPSEESIRAALGALAWQARRAVAGEIEVQLPYDDPFAVFVRQEVGADFTIRAKSTGGQLLCIVDLPELLRRLEPLFTRRLRDARAGLSPVEFSLDCDGERAGFRVSAKSVKVGRASARRIARVPRRWMTGLLTGYHTVQDIRPRKGVSIPAALQPVMDILFPGGWPFIYQGDNY